MRHTFELQLVWGAINVDETNSGLLIFFCLCLLPSYFFATSSSPSSCSICLSNYSVATKKFGCPTWHFFTFFNVGTFCLALSFMFSTSLCKTSFLYALVIILNRLLSQVYCSFSLPISTSMHKTIRYKFYGIFIFFALQTSPQKL